MLVSVHPFPTFCSSRDYSRTLEKRSVRFIIEAKQAAAEELQDEDEEDENEDEEEENSDSDEPTELSTKKKKSKIALDEITTKHL